MEAQVSLIVAFSSSAFFSPLALIFLLTIPHRFSMGFRSGEFSGQSSTPTPWSFNHAFGSVGVTDVAMPVRAVCKPHSPDLKKRRSSD